MADPIYTCRDCDYPLGDAQICPECGRPRSTRTKRWPDLAATAGVDPRPLRRALLVAGLAGIGPLCFLVAAFLAIGTRSGVVAWVFFALFFLSYLAYPCALVVVWRRIVQVAPTGREPGPLGPRCAAVGLAATAGMGAIFRGVAFFSWEDQIPAMWWPGVQALALIVLGSHIVWALRVAGYLTDHLAPHDRLGDATVRGALRVFLVIGLLILLLPFVPTPDGDVGNGRELIPVEIIFALSGLMLLLVATERQWRPAVSEAKATGAG